MPDKITPILAVTKEQETSNLSAPDDMPNEKITFLDRIRGDNVFKKVLKSISLMQDVLEQIEEKQEELLTYSEKTTKTSKNIEDKVDKLQETLDQIIKTDEQNQDQQEKQQREAMQEAASSAGKVVGSSLTGSLLKEGSSLASSIGLGLFVSYEIFKFRDEIFDQMDYLGQSLVGWVNQKINATLRYFGISSAPWPTPEHPDRPKPNFYASPYKNKPPEIPALRNSKSSDGGKPSGMSTPQGWRPKRDDAAAAEAEYARRTGGDLALAQTMAEIESGHNPEAGFESPEGLHYKGLYQASKFRQTAMESAITSAERTNSNREYFKKFIGRYPVPAEIYLLHQQGIAGGTAIMQAYYAEPLLLAYQGLAKYMRLYHNKNFTENDAKSHLRGNMWGALHKYAPTQKDPEAHTKITIKEFVELFFSDFNRRYDKYKKLNEDAIAGKNNPPPTGTTTPVAGSMVTAPDGMFAGSSGERKISDGVTYDKSGGKNAEGLDIITEELKKEGLLPEGTILSYNDKFHQENRKNSTHRKGLSLDISVPGADAATRQRLVRKVKEIGQKYGINLTVRDETGWGSSTGQHVHVQFESEDDANQFMMAYNKSSETKTADATPTGTPKATGQALMEKGAPTPAPQVVVVQAPQQTKTPRPQIQPMSKGGVSGSPPASFNYNLGNFLNNIT